MTARTQRPEEEHTIQAPRYDFHIHTKYLGCANETMEVEAIVRTCESLGVTKLGITDHLNTLDKLRLHRPIREDILTLAASVEIYFGVELNFVGVDGEFAYNDDVREDLGFQFAIGGIHGTYLEEFDIEKLVAVQHRHHLKTCEDPQVDVLVHPYWFGRHEFEQKGFPWFETMKAVPESMTRELGAAARETGTAIEVNACANLDGLEMGKGFSAEYVEYLAILESEGVTFAPGSDAHGIGSLQKIELAWGALEELGVPPGRVWRPSGEPLAGGEAR